MRKLCYFFAFVLLAQAGQAQQPATINLPTSKQLIGQAPGNPKQLNSLPAVSALSPDGRYLVVANIGFGTVESGYQQSLAVVDTGSGKLADFPESRTPVQAQQTLYAGLAFSRNGQHLYASLGSTTAPNGDGHDKTGSGILVYGFHDGQISFERLIHIPLVALASGHSTLLNGADTQHALPFPAGIAVFEQNGAEKLLVAGNLSDDVWQLDATSGQLEHRFDLAAAQTVPATYPLAVTVSADGQRGWVALWNSSEIVELNLTAGTVARHLALLKPADPVRPGSHPCAFSLAGDGRTLYVALANRDAVAVVDTTTFTIRGYLDTRLPGQSYFGAEPVAVTTSGPRIYVANMATDTVAVYDRHKLTARTARQGMIEPIGFIPTEWMPLTVDLAAGKLFIATGKGTGTGPNNMPQAEVADQHVARLHRPSTYIATLLHGSMAAIPSNSIDAHLAEWTVTSIESNRMKAADERVTFFDGAHDHIKHVIYIIKENRTYDQVLGDLERNGKPVGNGMKSLAMFGSDVTPNEHKLALEFGVLDNFFDSGEVSGDGHVWSTAAIGTDYLEKTWEQNYRGGQRTYDYEGVVADGYPLDQHISDVNEPASGYLWGNLAAHGKAYYHFGEYIASTFCNEKHTANPQQGPMLAGGNCAEPDVKPGAALPAEWGGTANRWPWPIPRMAANRATKPELVGHFAAEYPDFNLQIPDQVRADIFARHLDQWIADRKAGHDTMPSFVMLRFGNDHTAGTTPGGPTPRSSVADNDLAVGRAVEMISHSPYWDDTAFFILEDDAQAGADHVDAHRSIALVVSKYAPHTAEGGPLVDSRFYSTVSVIRTMESVLGLPPMNNNDAFSSLISPLFTGDGQHAAYEADYRNRDNGLIYQANQPTAVGAKESARMDFRHADHADTAKLNLILWQDSMGKQPIPPMLLEKHRKQRKDDDD